jgi:segregation and condensation protein B
MEVHPVRLVRYEDEFVMADNTTDNNTTTSDPHSQAELSETNSRRAGVEAEAPSEPARPRRSRKKPVMVDISPDPEPVAEQPVEQPAEHPDGQVTDTDVELDNSESESDNSDAAALPAIDLSALEALLFSTHHPLTAGRIAELLELDSTKPVRRAIKDLNEQYESTTRCFRVEQVAGGYQLLTLPEFGPYLKKLHQRDTDTKLTKAALETLAIIAYKQPILRADIEAIRGCACGETIRSLMEKHLVKIAGRAEEPGRPILYGTTKRFLELFGLNSLKDLPQSEGLPNPTST